MNRLEAQANDLAALDDSAGAALAIGKAAMMANIIAERHDKQPVRSYFESVEKFFRGQEYVYRALAIFEQTGGQPPAPNGVCQFLRQAGELISQSHHSLTEFTNLKSAIDPSQQRFPAELKYWQAVLPELTQDLAC